MTKPATSPKVSVPMPTIQEGGSGLVGALVGIAMVLVHTSIRAARGKYL